MPVIGKLGAKKLKSASIITKIIVTSLFVLLGFAILVITHELGHALGAKIVGNNVNFIHIWPGYELFPNIGQQVTYEWTKSALAIIQTSVEIDAKSQLFGTGVFLSERVATSIIQFMGSGITWLISIIFLVLMHFFRPKGVLLSISIIGALFYIDILSYSIFPYFFDLPHLIFIGGKYAEPVLALSSLGINGNVAATIIIFWCSIQTLILAKVLIGNRSSE